MFTNNDLKLFKNGIADLESSNDPFYQRQLDNIKSSGLQYDELAKLAAYFYTQKYRLARKQLAETPVQQTETILVHPAYKSGITPELVLDTYNKCGGNKCETARLLGVSIKTVYNRLKECGVQ